MSAPTVQEMAARAELLHFDAMELLRDASATEHPLGTLLVSRISEAADALEFAAAHFCYAAGRSA